MSHQTRQCTDCPRLGKVGLQFYILRIRILEKLLVLLVPALASNHHPQRGDVARFSDGRFPADGMQQVGRTGVGVGIAHLRDEVVLHGDLQIGILVNDGVESGRMTVHELILHRQRGELVTALCRGLPAIGPLARHNMHLIIAGAIDDVRRELG